MQAKQLLESILYLENQKIPYNDLCVILNITQVELLELLTSLEIDLQSRDSAIEIVKKENTVYLKPKDRYLEELKEKYKGLQEKKLTPTMLSVLGIIAYKGPLTKGEIDYIRGIDSSYVIKRLLQEGLIKLNGKKNILGQPNLYAISHLFLDFFGINSIKDLPNIEDFQSLYTNS